MLSSRGVFWSSSEFALYNKPQLVASALRLELRQSISRRTVEANDAEPMQAACFVQRTCGPKTVPPLLRKLKQAKQWVTVYRKDFGHAAAIIQLGSKEHVSAERRPAHEALSAVLDNIGWHQIMYHPKPTPIWEHVERMAIFNCH